MVCRSQERANTARDTIVKTTSNSVRAHHACISTVMTRLLQNVHVHVVDMSNARAVLSFATEFASSGQPLHVLVRHFFGSK